LLIVVGAFDMLSGMSSSNQFKQLSSEDIELLARLAERIHHTNSNEPFLNHSFVVLNEALPRTIFSIDSYSVNPVSFEQAVNVGISNDLYALYRTYMHQHPLVAYFLAPGESQVFTILDVTSSEEFHKTDLYQKFYQPLGVEDQLAFTLPHSGGMYVVVYSRDTAFTERERLMMKLLKPQILIALKNWQRVRDLELNLRTLEEKSSFTDAPAEHSADCLTPRQRAVAEQVALGLDNPQIAKVLHISPKTVGKHLENIFAALGIHHRAALASWWQQTKK
jgi:DNA-binding CsgD family transcriptional regulator